MRYPFVERHGQTICIYLESGGESARFMTALLEKKTLTIAMVGKKPPSYNNPMEVLIGGMRAEG